MPELKNSLLQQKIKGIYTKIPAIVGMIICVFMFSLIIAAIILTQKKEFANIGFATGIIIYYPAIISYLLYLFDAALSIVKAVVKIHPVFNSLLALAIVGIIPMTLWTLNSSGFYIGLLCIYYFVIFILEIVSVVKHVKIIRAKKA